MMNGNTSILWLTHLRNTMKQQRTDLDVVKTRSRRDCTGSGTIAQRLHWNCHCPRAKIAIAIFVKALLPQMGLLFRRRDA